MIAILTSLSIAYAGFAAICLSMQRHYRDAFGKARPPRLAPGMKAIGVLLLAASIVPCLSRGWQIGIVIWFGLLSVAAILLVWIFAYRPRLALALAPFAIAFAGGVSGVAGHVILPQAWFQEDADVRGI